MDRLREIEIGAYRELRGVKLEGAGAVNLLVGGNNTGKTSILEAIGLAARPFDPGQWVQTVKNRDSSVSVVDGLWGLFPGSTAISLEEGQSTSAPLNIRADFGNESRHLTAEARISVGRWVDIETERVGNESETEAQVEVRAELVSPSGGVHGHIMSFEWVVKRVPVGRDVPALRAFTVSPAMHRSTQILVGHLSDVINRQLRHKPVQLLKMFDPGVRDVLVSRSVAGMGIRVDHEQKGMVDLATFGDGMRRAFAISLVLERASGGVLLVDEVEANVHSRALDNFIPWLVDAARAADVQIVATTHSLETVDAFLGSCTDGDPGLIAYHLRRTKDGHVCRRRDLAGLREMREEGLDIR